jgi:HK97 family phage portal protein
MHTKTVVTSTWLNDNPLYSETSFESLVKHGWRKNELIFACISKTANTSAQVELKVYRDRDGEELPEHPLKKLIQRPNSFMSEFDFWAAVIIYLKLAGVAYFEKERSRGGQVVNLWPLRPDWVRIIPSKQTMIGAYEYGDGITKVTIAPEDMLRFQLFDPMSLFSIWPPAAVAARVGDVDNATTDFLKLFFQKGGTPVGLLKTVQRLEDAQVAQIRARWKERYGGYDNWADPAVLDSDASYQQIGMSFKDMGFETLDARNEARICMVMDVPPILVGAKIGLDRSTFSNYAEARVAWWEDSLVPQYMNLEDAIVNQLLPEYEEGLSVEWDYSRVSALQEDRNSRWSRATAAWNAGAITQNEFRAEVGLPDRPDGEVFKQSQSLLPAPQEDEEPEEEPEDEEEKRQVKAANPPDDDERRKHEAIITRAMSRYFEGEMKRIKRELNG